MTFKEKIINLRKIKGLTQDEFAKAVGVSRQAVYKWESGQSYPEVPKILEIKLLFNVSIDDLLDDSFDIPLPEKKKRKRNVSAVKAEAVKDVPAYESAPAALEPVEESIKAAEKEPVIVATPAQTEAPTVTEEPTVTEAAEKSVSDAAENESTNEAEEKKQRGFFSRIFGRK